MKILIAFIILFAVFSILFAFALCIVSKQADERAEQDYKKGLDGEMNQEK